MGAGEASGEVKRQVGGGGTPTRAEWIGTRAEKSWARGLSQIGTDSKIKHSNSRNDTYPERYFLPAASKVKMSPLENVEGCLAKEVWSRGACPESFFSACHSPPAWPSLGSATPRSRASESTPTPRKQETFHTCLLLLEILKLKIKRSFLSPKSSLPL